MKRAYSLYIILLIGCFSLLLPTSRAAGVSVGVYAGGDGNDPSFHDSYEQKHAFDDIEFHFRLRDYNLDLNYMGNDVSLQHLAQKIDSIGISQIDSIVVVSQSSPEGAYEYNMRLSRLRANAMYELISSEFPGLKEVLVVHPDGEAWDALREYVLKDTLMDASAIERIVDIIDSDINIATKKWRMEQQPEYRYLLSTYYPRIRNSVSCILYTKFKVNAMERPMAMLPAPLATAPRYIEPAPVQPLGDWWTRHLYIKTNVAAWALAISNLACEVDIAPHWSATLPIYYSAWNYGVHTLKFRTFSIMPEARYWLSRDNVGFFAGAHVGFAYYNFAFNGDLRYQDHNGTSPAWGGGLNVGYRLALDKPQRWHIEFELGAGVYSLYYDTFYNVHNGKLSDTYKDVYYGIDNVGITLSYRFDLDSKRIKR